ncbi:hypothetical protein FACS1894172_09540 [Spirochaetia bacterium]|nr:hypothetical protein FACS1894172_09540 [Spirochaetia bacterium]
MAVADIADQLISAEIDLLKTDASGVARQLLYASDTEFQKILQEDVESDDNSFIGFTVIDRTGIVASFGNAERPEWVAEGKYISKAFAGESIISTTRLDPGDNGGVVFHVYVPMEDRVLSATIPGMFFRNLLLPFKVWETGHIFIDDAEGTIISNIRANWVLERSNFIKEAETEPQYERVAQIVRRMIRGESGSGSFAMGDVERICVFRPITGSNDGWSLGVIAPLTESPARNANNGILMVGVVSLMLSIIAALFISSSIEKPYKRINDMVKEVEIQDELLHTINNATVILLNAETDNFENDIWKSMGMIARGVGVDRMNVWKNYTKDGALCCMEVYEWSEGIEPQTGKKITTDIPYSESIPGWEEKFSGNQCVNGIVRTFSEAEQAQLSPQGILSILAIPVFFQDRLWGFVSFNDCHKERSFSKDDENVLRSGSLLIASAILRNEMTHDLVRAREEAVASTTAKSDFLANMSHEMRTPLNAIIGLSELTLNSDEVDGDVRDTLEKVYNSGVTLLSLINDILDISKIESGKFELIPVEYDTPSIINDTVTLNIVRIGSKPIIFNLEIDENLPNLLIGDELRVKQIFNNLLSNAFKYTKEGTVTWQISSETDGNDVWLISSVKDSGIGIRPEDIKKLFSEYNQVDMKSNRKIEGTGLGLAICKRMVEMMDGTIKAESEYGHGTTFTIRIRQTKSGSAVIGPEVVANLKAFHYSDNKRDRSAKLVRAYMPYAKVLVVDDVPTNLVVARGMMNSYGMQIDCVTSGSAAIELIRNAEVKYNAIFMDHMMPGMDGIEATRLIREIGTEYARTVPVIALTANAIVGNEDMFLQNGFQAFLSKPIDIMRMDVIINHWVRDKELEKKLPAETLQMTSPKLSGSAGIMLNIKGLDPVQGVKRFGGDEKSYYDVLKSYAQNTPTLLEQLRDCREENLAEYAIVVHGIKGSSRSICAKAIGVRAEKLEYAAKSGDFGFVRAENAGFIQMIEDFLAELSTALKDKAEENPKTLKPEPDAEVLHALQKASENFDIDGVDKAMEQLEAYMYESGGELMEWLREQVSIMGFKQIAKRLAQD